jgi:hypothetical protein
MLFLSSAFIPVRHKAFFLYSRTTIATTIDGDIVVVVADATNPFIMLPRHSEMPLHFASFDAVITYYQQQYQLDEGLYFDTYHNSRRIYLPLHAKY